MAPSQVERRSSGSRIRRAVAALGASAAVAAGMLAVTGGVAHADTCANFELGVDHPGFDNSNTNFGEGLVYDTINGSPVDVMVNGAGLCEAPGRQFVRAEARLWRGTGVVLAYLEERGGGKAKRIAGTGYRQDPADFHTTAYSRIYNAAGRTVRACGRFWYGGSVEVRCSQWVRVPVDPD
jgi:hypothetical protein